MKLGILLTENLRLLSVAAMLDVFDSANRFYIEEGKAKPFEIELLCLSGHEGGVYPGYTVKNPDEAIYTLIFIPAFKSDAVAESVEANLPWIPWLHRQYKSGAAIASYCTGAFLLGASGLLNGRPATTHVHAWPAFLKSFPDVQVQAEAVVTGQDRIYTSGGATNSFHLMLLLLEQYCDRSVAVKAAKLFSVDMDRNRQLYFGSFTHIDDHGDELVRQAQEEIKKNFSTAATIEEIITDVPASRRNLVRRLNRLRV